MMHRASGAFSGAAVAWHPGGSQASGRLVAPGLILTAGHAMDFPSRDNPYRQGWRVRLLESCSAEGIWQQKTYDAQCVWRGRYVDLALLRIGDGSPVPGYEVVFTSLDHDIDDLEVIGYPRATWDDKGNAADYRVSGSLRIESSDSRFAFAIAPADVPRESAQWRGMSGAVVVRRDSSGSRIRVFGAVEEVNQVFSNGKLYMASIAAAFKEPDFLESMRAALGKDPVLIPKTNMGTIYVPSVSSEERVYATFHSSHQILYGRACDLDTLAMLLSRDNPARVIAVHAIGGMGKTALARECCIKRNVLQDYDLVLGMQAPKRHLDVDHLGSGRPIIREGKAGTALGPSQFLIEIARQLGMLYPDSRTAYDLERGILHRMKDRKVLFIVDNLETTQETHEMVSLLNRICSPPARKALVTVRQIPQDDSLNIRAFPLSPVQDHIACREIVLERVRELIRVDAENEFPDAIDAIVRTSGGHPLALRLLAGKLAIQGSESIMALRQQWESRSTEALGEEFLSALCNYVFDDLFNMHIGGDGAELLSTIADEDFGVCERELFEASELPREQFDGTLAKIFTAGCIDRQPHRGRMVLTMHSLTQAHFRSGLKGNVPCT